MSLRVYVQVWCEIDPTLNVRIDRQTAQPLGEPGDRLMRVSPLGRAGVEAALRLGAGEVTAFALGGGQAEALRHALAAGAGRAVELAGNEPAAISLPALAEWLRKERADLVIADRLAGLIAGRLGWAHLAGLDDLQVRDGVLRAVRCLERGDRERVTARLPAAVRMQNESVRVRYVARARLQAISADRIEREALPVEEMYPRPAEAGPLQVARPRTRMGKAPAPAAMSAGDRLQALMGLGKTPPPAARHAEKATATPDQMAEEFVRYLLHHNLLPEPDRSEGP